MLRLHLINVFSMHFAFHFRALYCVNKGEKRKEKKRKATDLKPRGQHIFNVFFISSRIGSTFLRMLRFFLLPFPPYCCCSCCYCWDLYILGIRGNARVVIIGEERYAMASPYTCCYIGPVTLEKIFISSTIDETVGKSDSFSKCHLLSASVDFCDGERDLDL